MYSGDYLPGDIKNWSNNEEVRSSFLKKYAGAYTNDVNLVSQKSNDAGYDTQSSEQRSEPIADKPLQLSEQSSEPIADKSSVKSSWFPLALVATDSQESTDDSESHSASNADQWPDIVEMASVSKPDASTMPRWKIVAAFLMTAGVAMWLSSGKS